MELPWYPHDIQDYDESTADLTLQQHGVYRRMLDHYYKTRGPLPAPLPAINRIVGAHTSSERRDISYILHRFFELKDDGWHQHRADDELTEADDITDKRSKAGSAGAAKRWRNHSKIDGKCHSKRMANGVANECTLNIEQGLETDVSKPKRASARVAPKHKFVLPDWVPKEAWDGFVEFRRRKGSFTERAMNLTIEKLEKFLVDHSDIAAVLDQSVQRGWTGVFPVKPENSNGSGRAPTAHENMQRGTVIALERLKQERQ